jgi:uncharacterized protein (DUF983 family)
MIAHEPEVTWVEGVRRGFAGRCPACSHGRLFGRFLKVRDECESCGTELHHHRADDLPPYLVILIVAHISSAGASSLPRPVSMTFPSGCILPFGRR